MNDAEIQNNANNLGKFLVGIDPTDVYSLLKIAANNKTEFVKLTAAAKTPGPPQVKITALIYCFYDIWKSIPENDKTEIKRIAIKYGSKIFSKRDGSPSEPIKGDDKKKSRLKITEDLGKKGYNPGEVLAGIKLIEDMYTTTGKKKKNAKLAVAERKTEQQEQGIKPPPPPPPPKKRQWQLSTAVFPDGAGMITPHGKGPQYYNDGDEVTIQFTPNPGTNFLHFMVNGNIFNASRVVRQANRFLSPLNQQQQGDRYVYILDVIMTMNLSIQAICDGEPRSNAPTINVTPTINTGPTNVKVKVKGGAGGGGNTFNLTCQIHPSTDGGTISGFENGGTRHYPAGSIAHVTTLTKEGGNFLGWIVDNQTIPPGGPVPATLTGVTINDPGTGEFGLDIVMSKNHNVIAKFEGGGAPTDFEVEIKENRHDGVAGLTRIDIFAKVKGGKDPYTYQWHIEDDEGEDAIAGGKTNLPIAPTADNFSVIFQEQGTYNVFLLVTDSKGRRETATAEKTIRAPFEVKIKEDKHSGDEPLIVKIWAEVDEKAKPYTFSWEFEDDQEKIARGIAVTPVTTIADSEDKAISHTFLAVDAATGDPVDERTYKVTLTVTKTSSGKTSVTSARKTVKKKKPVDRFKVIGPKKPSFLGAYERGAYNRVASDQTKGMTTMLPKLRIALMSGRRTLGQEARNYSKNYIRTMKEGERNARTALTNAREAYRTTIANIPALTQRLRTRLELQPPTGRGTNIADMIKNIGGAIAESVNTPSFDQVIAEQIRQSYDQLKTAQTAYETVVKGYTGDLRIRASDFREDLHKVLDDRVAGLVTSLKYRYHLIGMPGADSVGQDLSVDLTALLKAEAAWLADFWAKHQISMITRTFGRFGVGLRTMSGWSQGIGDVWDTITSNLWAFITGPIIWGTILILFQFGFMAAYAPPDLPGFLYYFPLISGALIWIINFANIKFFLETFDHLISGIIIGYGVVMLVASLGLYYVFGLSGWMGNIVYVVVVGILWLIGAFQIYAAGGFRVVVPIALIIMLFAWFSLGPYSGYIRDIRDQIVAPLKQVIYYVGDAVNDIWLLMTNPSEYFSQQQLKSARPEKALSYPKGIEAVRLDVLPEQVEEGGEFALYAVIKNEGEQKAENIKATALCRSDRYIPDKIQSNLAGLSCKEVTPLPISPQSPGKSVLNPGDGDTYQFLLSVGHMTASGTLDIGLITYTTNVKRVVFNKINLSIEYTYKTSSELTTEIATQTEIERRQLAKEQFYYQEIATAKVGPAMVGMTVGYQPLTEGRNAILLVNVLNKRPDGYVVLTPQTPLVVKIPDELKKSGTKLDCQNNLKATASCTGGTCTITPKQRIEINNRNYKESLAMICKFTVANDTLLDAAGSRTGVITATLDKYNFVYIAEKTIAVIPSPELTGQQSQLMTCAQFFDQKKANFNRLTGLVTGTENPFNWFQDKNNRDLVNKVAKDKGVTREEILTIAYYNPTVEGGTSTGSNTITTFDENTRGKIVQIARAHKIDDEGVRWILKVARRETGFGHCESNPPPSGKYVGEQGTCPSGQKVKCSSVTACGVMQIHKASHQDCYEIKDTHSSNDICSDNNYCGGKSAWDEVCNIDAGIHHLLRDYTSLGSWEKAVSNYNPGSSSYLAEVTSEDLSAAEIYITKYPLGSSITSTGNTQTTDLKTTLAALRKKVDNNCPSSNSKQAQLECVADQILASPDREKIKQSSLYQQCQTCFPLVEQYSGSSGSGNALELRSCENAGLVNGQWQKGVAETTVSPCDTLGNNVDKTTQCIDKVKSIAQSKGMNIKVSSLDRDGSPCDSRHNTGQAADIQPLNADGTVDENPDSYIKLSSIIQEAGCFTWVFNEDYQQTGTHCTSGSSGYHVHASLPG